MNFLRKLFSRKREQSSHKARVTNTNRDADLLTKDAMALDLGFWLGMLQATVETGRIHTLSQESIQPMMSQIKILMSGLGLKSGIDSKRGIEPIKEEFERICSPSCQALNLVGLLLSDMGHPQRPIRDPKEIEMIVNLIKPLGISESLLNPLFLAFSQNPPPSEIFNAALVNVKGELIQVLCTKR